MLKFPIGEVICWGEHKPHATYVQTQEHKGEEEKLIESRKKSFERMADLKQSAWQILQGFRNGATCCPQLPTPHLQPLTVSLALGSSSSLPQAKSHTYAVEWGEESSQSILYPLSITGVILSPHLLSS